MKPLNAEIQSIIDRSCAAIIQPNGIAIIKGVDEAGAEIEKLIETTAIKFKEFTDGQNISEIINSNNGWIQATSDSNLYKIFLKSGNR